MPNVLLPGMLLLLIFNPYKSPVAKLKTKIIGALCLLQVARTITQALKCASILFWGSLSNLAMRNL